MWPMTLHKLLIVVQEHNWTEILERKYLIQRRMFLFHCITVTTAVHHYKEFTFSFRNRFYQGVSVGLRHCHSAKIFVG